MRLPRMYPFLFTLMWLPTRTSLYVLEAACANHLSLRSNTISARWSCIKSSIQLNSV